LPARFLPAVGGSAQIVDITACAVP
jgi:hypothetical protein